jgi:HlyD family secretion protein
MNYRIMLILAATLAGCSGNQKNVITASGVIEGTDVNIGSEVSGRAREIRVDEGARVSKGDTLLIIDDTEYQIQLRQAVANMEAFASAYRLAVEGSRREDIVQAETAFKTAEADYRRMRDLLASQVVTQKQYDDAYAKYVAAQQTFEKVQKGSRSEEINAARQRRDYAAAQVDLLAKKTRDCHILAPSAGTVTLRAVEQGELVAVGMNLLRLTSLDTVKLMIYLNEQELARVHLGDPATISVDGAPGRSFEGRIVYLSPVAEFTPKNVQTKEERTKLVFGVKVEVRNPDGVLKPGLPADATILTRGN